MITVNTAFDDIPHRELARQLERDYNPAVRFVYQRNRVENGFEEIFTFTNPTVPSNALFYKRITNDKKVIIYDNTPLVYGALKYDLDCLISGSPLGVSE